MRHRGFLSIGPNVRSQAAAGAGAAAAVDPLFPLNLFEGGDEVVLRASVSGANYIYNVFQHIGGNKYWQNNWPFTATVGVNGAWIFDEYIVDYYRALTNLSTPAVTLNGTWQAAENPNLLTGYFRALSLSTYAEVTTSPGCTAVGCLVPSALTGAFMHIVSIDGSNTAADLLPTAQSLVDDGKLVATALVGGGGTLNPTDRILDAYNRSLPASPHNLMPYQLFTKSLSPGAHVIRITTTPYYNVSSAANFVGFGWILEGGDTLPNISAGNSHPFWVAHAQLSNNPRTNEVSYATQPTGATYAEWMGHTGTFKWAVLPAVTVDGSPITPIDKGAYAGQEIKFEMTFGLRHPEIGGGATDIATMIHSYTFNAQEGLTMAHTITWASGGTVYGYPFMMSATHALIDRFATQDYPAGEDLTVNDDAFHFNSDKPIAYSWDFDGNAAQVLYIPDLATTVNNWAETSGDKIAWADVSVNSGTWKKCYITRIKPARAYLTNEVFEGAINYRVGWFASGANAALAR